MSLVVSVLCASSATAGDFPAKKSISGELRFPSVSAVAVGFYSPQCAACQEALPKWRTYQKRFGPEGAVVLLFHPLKDGEPCAPDRRELAGFRVICDVGGKESESLGYNSEKPTAFLWSWTGELLASYTTPASVALQTESFLRGRTNITVQANANVGGVNPLPITGLIQQELAKTNKYTVSKSDDLTLDRDITHRLSTIGDCPLDLKPSGRALLVVSTPKYPEELKAQLYDDDNECLILTITVDGFSGPDATADQAVKELWRAMRTPVQEPFSNAENAQLTSQSSSTTRSTAPSVRRASDPLPWLEPIKMASIPLRGISINFLERWESYEETYLDAIEIDRDRSETPEAKIYAWLAVIDFEFGGMPNAFRSVFRERYAQARQRSRGWSNVGRAQKALAAARERKRKAEWAEWSRKTDQFEEARDKLNRFLDLRESIASPAEKDDYRRRFEAEWAPYLKARDDMFREKWIPVLWKSGVGAGLAASALVLLAIRPSQSEIDSANADYLSLGQDAVPTQAELDAAYGLVESKVSEQRNLTLGAGGLGLLSAGFFGWAIWDYITNDYIPWSMYLDDQQLKIAGSF